MEQWCRDNGYPVLKHTLMDYAGWDGVGGQAPLPPVSTRVPQVQDQLLDDGYACLIYQGGPPWIAEVPPEVNRYYAFEMYDWCGSLPGPDVVAVAVKRILEIYFVTDQTTLTWTPPTQNEDGTPLTDLCCYKIYYGQNEFLLYQEAEVNDPNAASTMLEIGVGSWYFEATALDYSGNESRRSNKAETRFDY